MPEVTDPAPAPRSPTYILALQVNLGNPHEALRLDVSVQNVEDLARFLNAVIRPRAQQLGYDVRLTKIPTGDAPGPRAL